MQKLVQVVINRLEMKDEAILELRPSEVSEHPELRVLAIRPDLCVAVDRIDESGQAQMDACEPRAKSSAAAPDAARASRGWRRRPPGGAAARVPAEMMTIEPMAALRGHGCKGDGGSAQEADV